MIETTTSKRVNVKLLSPMIAAFGRGSAARFHPAHRQPLAVRSTPAVAAAKPMMTSLALMSGRNLDLCLLFVCSCLLSLLCHQMSSLHTTAIATGSQLPGSTAPTSTLAQLDFLIKAGLKTSNSEEPLSDRE